VVFVLPDSLLEVGGDSDVELFEAAGEDVDVGEFADEGSFWLLLLLAEYRDPSLRSRMTA